MGAKRRPKGQREAGLTSRQREWLRHLRACEGSGETIKDYALRQGLSVQSLYQAGKRLRRRGVLEPRRQRQASPSPFVRVQGLVRPATAGPVWRVRLPSGVVFESSAALEPEGLVSLLERLARP